MDELTTESFREKMSDDICGCSEKKGDDVKKCMDETQKKWSDKMPKGGKETAKDMNDKDKAAMEKMMACSLKTLDLGGSK